MAGTPANDLNITQAGYVVFDGVATFTGRTFQAGPGITLTNPSGISGNTTISLAGGAAAIEKVNVQTGTSPILPTGGIITLNGATVAAGTNPVRTDGTASDTIAIEIQRSQAIAASDLTKVGLCNFNSSYFTVDANAFVALANPSGFPWTDVTGATQTLAVNNGYVTDHANVTYTLPSTAALGDTMKIVGKTGITTIAQNANQQILMSSASSTVGVTGSVAGTQAGDCIELICITAGASTVWRAANWVGNWTVT